MLPDNDINRFIEAQDATYSGYQQALNEIRDGKKTSHWIWYIFPQLRGLGFSRFSTYYGITGKEEAKAYLEHPILGAHLREITQALLGHRGKQPISILGDINATKVKSCMTLFDAVSPNDIFSQVLDTFYKGERCRKTLKKLNKEQPS